MRQPKKTHNPSGGGSVQPGGSKVSAPHKHATPKTPHKHLSKGELAKRRKDHAARVKTKAYQKHHAKALAKEKRRKLRKAIHEPIGQSWILGYNEKYDTCLATAFANSLLLQMAYRVSDDTILDLFQETRELSFDGTIMAIVANGLEGWYPDRVRPIHADVLRGIDTFPVRSGLILGVHGGTFTEPHTVVTSERATWITWGGELPPELDTIEDVHLVTWERR